MQINVCLSCDENYSKYAGVTIASILANADIEDELYFYILDGGISQDSKNKILSLKSIKDCNIYFVSINKKDFDKYKNLDNHSYISIATFYRLKLASLLPGVEKIIYLDCDVIVCSSLKTLFNIDLRGNILGGVSDIDRIKYNNPNYINAGVLLLDLNKIRESNIEEEILNYTKQNFDKIQLGDQGIINDALKGRILLIDKKYNVQSENFIRRSSYTKYPYIVHFIGAEKPWNFGSRSFHRNLYFKYLQITPWKLKPYEFLYWGVLNNIVTFFGNIKHRPFFFLQKSFWNAFIKTYYPENEEPIFAAVLMACFGDVILCNSLFQNIKAIYPNAKTVFIVDKPWVDAAKYQKDVDEVYVFDKRGKNRGLWGILKFVREFPYKNINCVFKIYDNFRVDLISFLLHPKKIIGKPYNFNVTVQERHNHLLKRITNEEIRNYPITYIAESGLPQKFRKILPENKKYIALCTATKQDEKDMPFETAVELISKLNNNNYEVLFVGTGDKAKKYARALENQGCNFINLVNKTGIKELAQVLKICKALISVDTGTMHFSYANKVPTICVFYKPENIKWWAPNKELYPFTSVVSAPCNAGEIYKSFNNLIQANNILPEAHREK